MQQVRCELGQRAQHKAVSQDIVAWDTNRSLVYNKIVVEQQVYIERTLPPLIATANPARKIMNKLDSIADLHR